ncbi:uncharacterized protein EI90DRAFT_3083382 [Cantharellus anzutake]|uniref:uncharacterized protein n=1 Tax=Cantharellus anzutake TaxID=1750568 RepID=UPI001904D5CA|nr:uncharacterized protein EI90DRAFT_3083382 [Cantharellus anzutake]KAF8318541.1 hypothetical protein EI90DRAFT_3083382 [Cantharellus anzutake]
MHPSGLGSNAGAQLEASFCRDYRGDNVQILPQALGVYDKTYDSTLYCGRSIPIL